MNTLIPFPLSWFPPPSPCNRKAAACSAAPVNTSRSSTRPASIFIRSLIRSNIRLWVRLFRKFWRRPYRDAIPRGFADEVRREVITRNAGWILINQTEAAPLIPELADLQARGVRIALLSHGTDSCDYIHLARARTEFHQGRPISSHDKRWIGGLIFEEQIHHTLCDAVFCLSETDRHLGQWLGGRKVTVLPRVIADRTLPWTPVAGRIGTVGTLTHGP